MARWAPGAAGRLQEAALDLYVDRGYEQTTVAEIAERAGVTARTFFRHYADKREVLFAGSEVLQQAMAEAVAQTPDDATTWEALEAALDAAADLIGSDHDHSSRRARVISANPELLERELAKMARLGLALTDGLVARGVVAPEARMAAESSITVFRIGFEQWVDGPGTTPLADVFRDVRRQLREVAG